MSTSSRTTAIMEILNQAKKVSVYEFSKELSVTVETVRRDLAALERQGKLRRVRGGAELIENPVLKTEVQTESVIAPENTDSAKDLAVAAAKMIKSGMTVMLYASDFSLNILANVRPTVRLTVITNSLEIINKYKHRSSFSFICTGGDFDVTDLAFYGVDASSTLRHYNADIAFLSCDSIALDIGVMHKEVKPSELFISMAEQADERVLLVSKEQFDLTSKVNTVPFSDISTIITDSALDDEWTQFLKEEDVAVRVCDTTANTSDENTSAAQTNKALTNTQDSTETNSEPHSATNAENMEQSPATEQSSMAEDSPSNATVSGLSATSISTSSTQAVESTYFDPSENLGTGESLKQGESLGSGTREPTEHLEAGAIETTEYLGAAQAEHLDVDSAENIENASPNTTITSSSVISQSTAISQSSVITGL